MQRTIRVTGKSALSVKPDLIRLNLDIEGIFEDYGKALEESSLQTAAIRKALESVGLNGKDLKTTKFFVNAEYESYRDKRDNYRKRFVGYKFQYKLYIQFPVDNQLLGKVLYVLAQSDVKTEISIGYTVSHAEKVKNDLLEKAVQDAKDKASVLAQASNLTLGEILSIDYSWGEMTIYQETSNDFAMAEPQFLMQAGSYNMDIEPDDIDVEDTVTIIWAIS